MAVIDQCVLFSNDGFCDKEEKSETAEENRRMKEEWIDDFEPLKMDDYLDGEFGDNHGDASFTGVWHAAKGLLQFLQQQQQPGQNNVLELGAGTGWLGLTMARNCPSLHRLVLTDSSHTGASAWTQSNLQAARRQELPHMDRVQVEAMDWNNEEQVDKVAALYPFDLILGSDLIYSEDRIQPLARTIASLLRKNPKSRCLYGHTQGRMPEMDQLWEQELKANGLTWQILETIPQWDERKTVIMDIRLEE